MEKLEVEAVWKGAWIPGLYAYAHCYELLRNSVLLQHLEGSLSVLDDQLHPLCQQLVYWRRWE